MTTRSITKGKLIDYLKEIHGSTFISVVTNTEPTMRKTGNKYAGRIRKVNKVSGRVNFQYEEGVRRRLEKAGKNPDDFVGGTSWHEPVKVEGKMTPLCKHKTKDDYYLRFALENAGTPTYIDENGNEVAESELSPFFPEKKSYANQGLDDEDTLKILTYGLDSIESIQIKGETLVVS